jgi:hypothetical protein
MREATDETPLRVCRKCSVAARTDHEACAECGHPYVRRGPKTRVLVGLGLAVVCICAGFLLTSSDKKNIAPSSGDHPPTQPPARSGGLTYQDAYYLKLGTPYGAVVSRFGPPLPNPHDEPSRVLKSRCFYYPYAGHPQATFQLCFDGRRGLVTLATRLTPASRTTAGL